MVGIKKVLVCLSISRQFIKSTKNVVKSHEPSVFICTDKKYTYIYIIYIYVYIGKTGDQ